MRGPDKRLGCQSWVLAFKLLLGFQCNRSSKAEDLRKTITRQGATVDRYMPPGKVLGTVVCIHGMSTLGREDPRIVNLGEALAVAGWRVLIPEFHSIRKLEIRREQPNEVQQALENLAADQELLPEETFSVLAISFSAVFALRVACSERLGRRIRALCLIGGYYDLHTVCSFLVNADRSDPYGRLLMLRSYYREIEPESGPFHQILDRCIEECVSQKNRWDARRSLDRSDPLECRIYRMLTDVTEREMFKKKMTTAFDQSWSGYRTQLDFVRKETAVLLIHGRDDRVIPAGESKRLARRLAGRQIPVYLCITRFLSHGDSTISLRQLPELYRLLGGFSWFFRYSLRDIRKRLR